MFDNWDEEKKENNGIVLFKTSSSWGKIFYDNENNDDNDNDNDDYDDDGHECDEDKMGRQNGW